MISRLSRFIQQVYPAVWGIGTFSGKGCGDCLVGSTTGIVLTGQLVMFISNYLVAFLATHRLSPMTLVLSLLPRLSSRPRPPVCVSVSGSVSIFLSISASVSVSLSCVHIHSPFQSPSVPVPVPFLVSHFCLLFCTLFPSPALSFFVSVSVLVSVSLLPPRLSVSQSPSPSLPPAPVSVCCPVPSCHASHVTPSAPLVTPLCSRRADDCRRGGGGDGDRSSQGHPVVS